MSDLDPSFVYMLTLSVIQPARIQDIEDDAPRLAGPQAADLVAAGALRAVHKDARADGVVVAVRKGLYVLSRAASEALRRSPIARDIDNRRLFLIKSKRKKIV